MSLLWVLAGLVLEERDGRSVLPLCFNFAALCRRIQLPDSVLLAGERHRNAELSYQNHCAPLLFPVLSVTVVLSGVEVALRKSFVRAASRVPAGCGHAIPSIVTVGGPEL
jgi:hypothetical protein